MASYSATHRKHDNGPARILFVQFRAIGPEGKCFHPSGSSVSPRVSAFTSADIPKILDLRPDLVLRSAGGFAEEGHTPPVGLNGAVTLQSILDRAPE
jgi:hypothetical protein